MKSQVYSMAQNSNKRSEDEIGEKYDACITDTIVKTGTGVGIGVLLSLVAFQRKAWPIAFSTGMGLGMAIANCQNEFKSIYPTKTIKVVTESVKDIPEVVASEAS